MFAGFLDDEAARLRGALDLLDHEPDLARHTAREAA
jgi:hypothetical protein